MDTISLPQSQTQIYQLPFIHNPTRSLLRIAGLLLSYSSFLTPPLTTFAANLKLHTNLSPNHVMPHFHPPHIGLASGTYAFLSVLCALMLKTGTVCLKAPFLFHFITICLTMLIWGTPDANQLFEMSLKRTWYNWWLGTPKFRECIFARIFYLRQKSWNFLFYNIMNQNKLPLRSRNSTKIHE